MKQITLDGRLGKDAVVMKTNNGKEYIRFSLANDSFVNGTNKTEWFEISCFDPFYVEKKLDFFKQGRYVIVQGTLNSEVTAKNGKVYLNHYVKANNIETPSFGTKKESNEVQVSTYTGGTKPEQVVEAKVERPAPVPQTVPQPQVVTTSTAASGWGGDDDLPF